MLMKQQDDVIADDYSSLAKKGKYLLEFQVIIDDYTFHPDDECILCIFDDGCHIENVMQYNERLNSFQFMLEKQHEPLNNVELIYKYFILRDKNKFWEKMPKNMEIPFWNRKCKIRSEFAELGHVIIYDAATLKLVDERMYKNLKNVNLLALLPPVSLKKLQNDAAFLSLLNMYYQWANAYFSDVFFVDQLQSPINLGWKLQTELQNTLASHLEKYHHQTSQLDGVRRVVQTIYLLLALSQSRVTYISNNLKIQLCVSLSLGDSNEETIQLVKKYIQNFKRLSLIEIFGYGMAFEYVFTDMVKMLDSVPHVILLLPFICLVHCSELDEIDENSIKLLNWNNLRSKFRRSQELQRPLWEIQHNILLVAPQFPWMVKLYVELLNLESTANILNTSLSSFVKSNTIITKIHYFWRQLSVQLPKENLSGEVLIKLCSFVIEIFRTKNQLIENERKFKDIESRMKCFATCSCIVASIKKCARKPIDLFLSHMFLVFDGIFEYSNSLNKNKDFPELIGQCRKFKDELLSIIPCLMEHECNIKIWNFLSEIAWTDSNFTKDWLDKIFACSEDIIKKRFDSKQLIEFYCDKLQRLNPNELVENWFTEQVETHFLDIMYSKDYNFLKKKWDYMMGKSNKLELSSRILCKQWSKHPFYNDSKVDFLDFIHNLNPMFLQTIVAKGLQDKLPKDLKYHWNIIESDMHQVLEDVLNGIISIGFLNKLIEMKDSFELIMITLKKERKSSSVDQHTPETKFSELIALRKTELCWFNTAKTALQSFVNFFIMILQDQVKFHFEPLFSKINKDVSDLPLDFLINCAKGSCKITKKFHKPVIKYFDLHEDDINFIVLFKNQQNLLPIRKVAFKILTDILEEKIAMGLEEIDVHEIIELLWKPLITHISDIVREIESGEISMERIDKMFAVIVYDLDNEVVLQQEIEFLHVIGNDVSLSLTNKKKHIEKITHYFKMKKNLTAARLLNQMKIMLKLEGDFEGFEDLLELAETAFNQQLDCIDEKILQMNEKLALFTKKSHHVPTLEKFVQAEDLVNWLQQNIKDSKELKVMIDLAMISAGETPLEVDRVSCFNSAVMAFAPLVFDLPPSETGLSKLILACEEVWITVETDQNLLKKWEEASLQLGWLEHVKSFHGSVEKSSLEKAQSINSSGFYQISTKTELVACVENSIKLYLTNEEMSLNDLRDLQSRLMLIAGESSKGKDDVLKFMSVLSGVENLTKTYVKLKRSGCSLFNDWFTIVHCGNEHRGNVTVEVYFDKHCQAITSSDIITDELVNLTSILDEAYEQWINHMSDTRTKYYHLNHYTIQQLIFLCQELVKNGAANYSDQLYQLLANVVDNIDYKMIRNCLNKATQIDDEIVEDSDAATEDPKLSDTEKKLKMVRQLVRMEISEDLAKAAVQKLGYDDQDELLVWALSCDEEYEELTEQFDLEIGFNTKSNVTVVHSIVNDRSSMTLKSVIVKLQSEAFSSSVNLGTIVKTICERYFQKTAVTSLEDYLSLEHCGKFLEHLSQFTPEYNIPHRMWSSMYTEGKPNLVVCQHPQDILPLLLSVYAFSPKESFPSASEVLLCCENTSNEEVELLFRRALAKSSNAGERIYCLAQADLLSFKVAKKAEECFENLTYGSEKNDKYRLVILTCSYQHYLTSCFYEYKVDGYCASNELLKTYIKDHLCQKNIDSTAATFDKECSSVRVIRSAASGMGKSLFISRRFDDASKSAFHCHLSTIRLLEKEVDNDDVIDLLIDKQEQSFSNIHAHFVHIDITPSVQYGKSKFLFDLLILQVIQNRCGVVWRHCPKHLYMIEYTSRKEKEDLAFTNFFDLLPTFECLPPAEVQDFYLIEDQEKKLDKIYMDECLLANEMYQRPFQYLQHFSNHENLDNFIYSNPKQNAGDCLGILLTYCSISNPSWSELSHFSKFLNTHLFDCEQSVFCDLQLVGQDSGLSGFKQFVVRFMIRMSQDFATSSFKHDDDNFSHSNDTDYMNKANGQFDLLEMHQLRRHWENSFHPYLFFNSDRVSLSFANFNVNKHGHLLHPKTLEVVEEKLMPSSLVEGLKRNGVKFQHDIEMLSRAEHLALLGQVFGVKTTEYDPKIKALKILFDPDKTYELTTDNVLKMLAIQMRFRCGIPVVVMGETGCGKTRMIEFISKLKTGGSEMQNLIVVKVHGGVTGLMVQREVVNAVKLSKENNAEIILFLDEANTTEAIYAIKEIVCDKTVRGKPFDCAKLRIIAACNPYRTHKSEAIKAMEKSGLGFHVQAHDVSDTFDGIPMRHLVYRVISLPPSMQPFVWDFGQLNNETESIYIKQMVLKLQKEIITNESGLELSDKMVQIVTLAISKSQQFMRNKEDICSFVSLRDAERTIQSFKWFFEQLDLLSKMIDEEKILLDCKKVTFEPGFRALVQALSMCYHVTLIDRKPYRDMVAEVISNFQGGDISEKDILEEIVACQNVFINAIQLQNNIACNDALRENVFMMVICAEMRIPLFLVGKPGSSKSLAKTIVTDAMQGKRSKTKLYQHLKEVHVLSFQCSAATDAVGIEAIFSQCAQLQKQKDLNKYVAIVVLDEIGLAEDSKKMPLKILHPLLETASSNNKLSGLAHQRVGFIGISNWALDPAKMNRGIFVTRDQPSDADLHKTAEAIFKSDKVMFKHAKDIIKALTFAYLEVYNKQTAEFFGLRDYYALLKMLCSILSNKMVLDCNDVGTAIIRNFSGQTHAVFETFKTHCKEVFGDAQFPHITSVKLINENLKSNFETRFLLLLTKQYSAVHLLPEVMGKEKDYIVIFGSSFPHDHDYTEVCRNINKIKVCMETGQTVVLLNLKDLYESLYDALNQHYVTCAGQCYIDLGLGGHRVKCRIAPKFRLIVIEEKEIVYNEYPIPLINRLEKHIFEMNSILTPGQTSIVNELKNWVIKCSNVQTLNFQRKFNEKDVFIGYNEDSAASALLSVTEQSFEASQKVLLQTASVDGICRLAYSENQDELDKILELYMKEQTHGTLVDFLKNEFLKKVVLVYEITSFSQMLNEKAKQKLQSILNIAPKHFILLTLQQFQTEQQFSDSIVEFMQFVASQSSSSYKKFEDKFLLLIQCTQAHLNGSLVACAKYATLNKIKKFKHEKPEFNGSFVVCFLLTLERQTFSQNPSVMFANFYCNDCNTVYIDELKPDNKPLASINKLWNLKVTDVFSNASKYRNSDNAVVDLKALIEESIQKAMAKLQNRYAARSRNRIHILMTLLSNNKISSAFFDLLVSKIESLIKNRNANLSNDDWIVEQASSSQALREGGSFKNVLWLHLKKIIACALAKVISIADADNNLDLLQRCIDENSKLAELWLIMFQHNFLWDLQWYRTIEANEYKFYVEGEAYFTCTYPFSRLILDFLMKEWLFIQETNAENIKESFTCKIVKTPLIEILETSERIGISAIEAFINDLVFLIHKPRSEAQNKKKEVEIVQHYFLHLFLELQPNMSSNLLLETYMLIIENKEELQQFADIFSIYPGIGDCKEEWLEKQNINTFLLHVSAFESLITHLNNVAKQSFGSVNECQQWKLWVAKTKLICEKVLPVVKKSIQVLWEKILFVEMFLEELLPTDANEIHMENYLKPLARHARLLWSGAAAVNNLSNYKFFRIVVNTLKKSFSEIKLHLHCRWNDTKCQSCQKDMKEPVELLACHHWFCSYCVLKKSNCPFCRVSIEQPQLLTGVQLNASQARELESYKLACDSFFLAYLSNICFPPVHSGQAGHNLSLLDEKIFRAVEELVIADETTKSLSPGLAAIDLNPTARSYILQLLLRYDEASIETNLENHFQRMEKVLKNKSFLMEMFIQCKQDILLQDCSFDFTRSNTDVQFAHTLFNQAINLIDSHNSCNQIKQLRACAMLQFVAKAVSQIIYLKNEVDVDDAQKNVNEQFIKFIIDNSADPKFLIFHQFIIKWLCRRYGLDVFDKVISNQLFIQLVPENLLLANNQQRDYYLVSDKFSLTGETYLKIKSSLLDITQECDVNAAVHNIINDNFSTDDHIQILFAVSIWFFNGRGNKLRQQTFQKILENLSQKVEKSLINFFENIVDGYMESYKCDETSAYMQYLLVEVLTHFKTVLLMSRNSLLCCFTQLINNPASASNLFLPVMSGTKLSSIKNFIFLTTEGTLKTYCCPNGHPYYIGECTMPYQESKCIDCGEPIGGLSHKLTAGNREGEMTEQSQAGYKGKYLTYPVAPERNLSKLSVAVIRICLHASLLFGTDHGNALSRVIGCEEQRVNNYLLDLIIKDFNELAKCLGRSVDDAATLLHLCFNRMRNNQHVTGEKFSWNSMEDREAWENEFQNRFLAPIFSNATNSLNQAQDILIKAGKLADRPLERLVYELRREKETLMKVVPWNYPGLWKYKIHVEVEHLRQHLETIDGTSNVEGSALKAVLNTENLELIQHLYNALSVQSVFINKYKQKVDLVDSEKITIHDFLSDENYFYEAEVNSYIELWNKMRLLHLDSKRLNVAQHYFDDMMSADSPISMCLPSLRGRGICALIMVEYLIDKQNNILHLCRELVKVKPSIKVCDVRNLVENDLIRVDSLQDFMPIILENSQYETVIGENGPTCSILYNLGLLQKKVLHRYFYGKKFINTETVPLMKYPQDMGLSKDFETIQNNYKQVQLPNKICLDIDGFVEKSSTAKLCEVVRTVTLLVQFLAKNSNIALNRKLCEYADKELLLPTDELELIPRSTEVVHCLSLFERFSWHRSVRLVRSGENPFEFALEGAENITDDSVLAELTERLKKINISRLQMELNSLIMVGPSSVKLHWGLAEVLENYLEGKNDDNNSWCQLIPEKVLYKHSVHVFILCTENFAK